MANYFNSENVRVFPASYRKSEYAASAEQLTEYNLLRVGGALNATDGKYGNYIISYNSPKLICVIGGYYFEIDNITVSELAGKCLCINTINGKLSSWESGASAGSPLDVTIEGTDKFTGLKISDTAEGESIQPFDANGNINYRYKLPKISAGISEADNAVALNNDSNINNEASGAASLAHGKNTIAAGEASHAEGFNTQANASYSHAEGIETITKTDQAGQTVVGKYNEAADGQFIVGAGENGARKNALVVNGNKTTISEELEVKDSDNNSVLKATKAETKVKADSIKFSLNTNEHIDIDENSIKVCLHKGDTNNTKGKLVLKDGQDGTSAELNAKTIDLKGDTTLTGTLEATDKVTLKAGLDVTGDTAITGNVTASGDATVTGKITGSNGLEVTGNAALDGKVTISNSTAKAGLDVHGTTSLKDALEVLGSFAAKNKINIYNDNKHATIAYNKNNSQIEITIDNNATHNSTPQILLGVATENSTGIVLNGTELAAKVKDIIMDTVRTEIFESFYPEGSIYTSYAIDENTKDDQNKNGCPIAVYEPFNSAYKWVRITDTFLYAAKEGTHVEGTHDYFFGDNGGSKDAELIKHTHTISAETGKHKHTIRERSLIGYYWTRPNGASNSSTYFEADGTIVSYVENDGSHKGYGTASGVANVSSDKVTIDMTHNHLMSESGQHSHAMSEEGTAEDGVGKNMPPYECVYMWKRVKK